VDSSSSPTAMHIPFGGRQTQRRLPVRRTELRGIGAEREPRRAGAEPFASSGYKGGSTSADRDPCNMAHFFLLHFFCFELFLRGSFMFA
jgi:hypothetical protein